MSKQDQLEYRELYELFSTFDKDGNGVISIEVAQPTDRNGVKLCGDGGMRPVRKRCSRCSKNINWKIETP